MRHIFVALILSLMLGNFATSAEPAHEKKAFLWLDAHANFKRLGTKAGVDRVLKEAKSVGFTDVILGLKGIDGYVVYPSRIAPVLHEFHGFRRPDSYNFPEVVLKEAHKLGLKVYFGMEEFQEGEKKDHRGIVYTTHPNWQCQVYTPKGIVPMSQTSEGAAVFVNPVLPQVRKYEISLWQELLRMYKPDGIVLDGARYPNTEIIDAADFSNASRKAFESFVGEKIKKWPQDVFRLVSSKDGKVIQIPGTFFRKWIEWHAEVIHNFIREIRDSVKKIDSRIVFSDYVGAWYPIYYQMGVNWASRSYNPAKHYDWADPTYYRTGYAELLDNIFVGTYFYDVTEKEAVESHTPSPDSTKKPSYYWWYSVDGSAKIAMKVTKGVIPVYGSLYVQQYIDKQNPQQFVRAIKADLRLTDGVMIFDVVHLDKYGWWKYAKEGLEGR